MNDPNKQTLDRLAKLEAEATATKRAAVVEHLAARMRGNLAAARLVAGQIVDRVAVGERGLVLRGPDGAEQPLAAGIDGWIHGEGAPLCAGFIDARRQLVNAPPAGMPGLPVRAPEGWQPPQPPAPAAPEQPPAAPSPLDLIRAGVLGGGF